MKARVIIILVVFTLALSGIALAAGPFSGLWSADLTIAPLQTVPISAFNSRLITTFQLGVLSASSRSDFIVDSWLWQSFKIAAEVPPFYGETNLLFEANPWVFRYGNGIASVDVGPISLRYSIAFLGSAYTGIAYRGSIFEISSITQFITLRSITHFGATYDGILFIPQTASIACSPDNAIALSPEERYYSIRPFLQDCLTFTEQEFIVEGCICSYATLTATTRIQTSGFTSQSFVLDVQSIAGLPINMKITTVLDLSSKSLTLEPEIMGLGTSSCGVHFMADLITQPGNAVVTGVSLYGLDIYLLTDKFGIRSLSLLDKARYSLYETTGFSLADSIWIAGKSYSGICGHAGQELLDYWEVLGLFIGQGNETTGMDFLVLTFFSDNATVFDWGKTEFRARVHVMRNLTLRSTVTVKSQGFASWSMGIDVSW